MSDIAYTTHAKDKFALLARYGFEVTPDQVEDTLSNPERIIPQTGGRFIAQKSITQQHVLRVVYREENKKRMVITFYPGRKERYETKL